MPRLGAWVVESGLLSLNAALDSPARLSHQRQVSCDPNGLCENNSSDLRHTLNVDPVFLTALGCRVREQLEGLRRLNYKAGGGVGVQR